MSVYAELRGWEKLLAESIEAGDEEKIKFYRSMVKDVERDATYEERENE